MKKNLLFVNWSEAAILLVFALVMAASCASSGAVSTGQAAPFTKWSPVANPNFGTSYVRALYFDGSNFLAAGDRGVMVYSADGTNWKPVNSAFDGTRTQCITSGKGTYIAVGDDSKMSRSTNGTAWAAVPGIPISKILVVAYGLPSSEGAPSDNAGVFVAGGSEGSVKMIYSKDGTSWTQTDSTFGDSDVYAIAYGDGKFIAAGTGGKMASSTDGIHWTAIADSGFAKNENINAIAYNGSGTWAAGGAAGKVAYSKDGITWTQANVPARVFDNKDIRRMTCSNGKFVTGGQGGIMAYSTDGIEWTPVRYGFEEKLILALAYGNGKLIIGGQDGKMAWSIDE